MNVGNRSLRAVVRAPLQAGHYRALVGMALRYPDPLESGWRFLSGRGAYPHRCRVRTPSGTVSPTLYSSHDMSTVNEVFCRLDYRSPPDLRVAVDVGANIGIPALYFLSRNAESRVYLFEPDPRNVERLRANLGGYEQRMQLQPLALGTSEGEAAFGQESSGRYGTLIRPGVEADGWERTVITVGVRPINDAIAEVLERERGIDVLKIDTEGTEAELVAAISPELLERITAIYHETNEPAPLHRDRYAFHYSCQTNRLTARR